MADEEDPFAEVNPWEVASRPANEVVLGRWVWGEGARWTEFEIERMLHEKAQSRCASNGLKAGEPSEALWSPSAGGVGNSVFGPPRWGSFDPVGRLAP